MSMEASLLSAPPRVSPVRGFPPCPTGPLVRQRATGADSPSSAEIHLADRMPEYYDRISFKSLPAVLTIENVLAAMKRSLPVAVQPHIKYVPSAYSFGRTFTIVLRTVSNEPSEDIRRLSEADIRAELAWEYVACDYIRYRYLGKGPLRLATICPAQYNIVVEVLCHLSALHDSLKRKLCASGS